MWRRVDSVITDVSEKHVASIIRVDRFSEVGTTVAITMNRRTMLVTANAVTSALILFTVKIKAIRPSVTSVLRPTRRNITEDGILPISMVLEIQIKSKIK
jgi:hypothetical protein